MNGTNGTGNTALVVMDVMTAVVPAFGGGQALLDNTNRALEAAREQGLPTALGRVAFRPGYPDVSDDNLLFSGLKDSFDFTETNPETGFHPDLVRAESDLVFTKRRVSSFAGSDLEVLLRSHRVERLVLTGVATSGVVLSTLRAAADLDYAVTVLEDACGDRDDEVHRVLTTKVFPRQARVVSTSEWIAGL